jgi:hypothetical protein
LRLAGTILTVIGLATGGATIARETLAVFDVSAMEVAVMVTFPPSGTVAGAV